MALLVAVVGGVAAGTYWLLEVFQPPEPAGRSVTHPEASTPDGPPPRSEGCLRTELAAELDGDGVTDRVMTWGELQDEHGSCDDPQSALSYRVAVILGTGQRFEGPAPACRWPHRCALVAAPDLDADGRAEIVLSPLAGASTVYVHLYGIDLKGSRPLEPIEIIPPGALPWHHPGPAEFTLYGSVTHQGALRCEDSEGDGRRLIAVGMSNFDGPYRVHEATFTLGPKGLAVTDVRDYSFTSYEDPRLRRAEQGPDICGAPMADV